MIDMYRENLANCSSRYLTQGVDVLNSIYSTEFSNTFFNLEGFYNCNLPQLKNPWPRRRGQGTSQTYMYVGHIRFISCKMEWPIPAWTSDRWSYVEGNVRLTSNWECGDIFPNHSSSSRMGSFLKFGGSSNYQYNWRIWQFIFSRRII